MAKAVRGSGRKTAARKFPAKSKRRAVKPDVTSDKLRALVYNLSAPELDELIRVATGRKNEELATAKAGFLDEVKARAASLGMSLADLVGLGGVKQAASAAKYRNPSTGETWSGRGRPARWISELEAKGRKREEFQI